MEKRNYNFESDLMFYNKIKDNKKIVFYNDLPCNHSYLDKKININDTISFVDNKNVLGVLEVEKKAVVNGNKIFYYFK